jgi:hypothetical protein
MGASRTLYINRVAGTLMGNSSPTRTSPTTHQQITQLHAINQLHTSCLHGTSHQPCHPAHRVTRRRGVGWRAGHTLMATVHRDTTVGRQLTSANSDCNSCACKGDCSGCNCGSCSVSPSTTPPSLLLQSLPLRPEDCDLRNAC